ncbi:MAG TPA: methylated-DNA--[protein]-cysteine S-methyltransferase [Limnobacter sp.]|nr:methylated-DNA--[protein]-cysteine S-methyltransferase [Limnobacter sp.]
MNLPEQHRHYLLIERAIAILERQARLLSSQQSTELTLESLAALLHVSPAHLQRVFTAWAGLSPKQLFQCLQQDHARRLLSEGESILNTSITLGMPSSSKIHHLMLKFEALTPGEIKNGGSGLTFTIGSGHTPFGMAFVGLSPRGLNNLEFETASLDYAHWADALKQMYPQARFQENHSQAAETLGRIFSVETNSPSELVMHLRGTPFQMQVWQALMHIPPGQLVSYQQIANCIGKPSASRAVGSAIARNSVGYLIPCHRVIQATGTLGQYRWESQRKKALHLWEHAAAAQRRFSSPS